MSDSHIKKNLPTLIIILILMLALVMHVVVVRIVNSHVEAYVDEFVKNNEAVASIQYAKVNASLLTLFNKTFSLSLVNVHWKDKNLAKYPLKIKYLGIQDPKISKNQLISAQVNFKEVTIPHLPEFIFKHYPLPEGFSSNPIKAGLKLSFDGDFAFNARRRTADVSLSVSAARESILRYEASFKNFEIPKQWEKLTDVERVLINADTETGQAKIRIPLDLLDPLFVQNSPELRYLGKELGYADLKSRFRLDAFYDAESELYKIKAKLAVKDAARLNFEVRYTQSPRTLNRLFTHIIKQSISPDDLVELGQMNIQYINITLQDKGLMQRIYPVSKTYLDVGQEDIMSLMEEYAESMSIKSVKQAIYNAVSFIDLPGSLAVVLVPQKAFNPYEISDELQARNQENFRQFELENGVARNDEERYAIERHYRHKQNLVVDETLKRLGFKTEYEP